MVKKSPDNAGDVGGMGSMPGSEKSPGEGQLFLPGEPIEQRSLKATVHGVTKNQTQLSMHANNLQGVKSNDGGEASG